MHTKILLLLTICGLTAGKEYSLILDSAEKYNVTWSFEETTPSSEITFTVRCKTTGWVGLGFSPNGGMANADIVMAWVTSDGTAHILDMYATANGAPVKDSSQDVTLVSATESNGETQVTFKRKLNSCDKEKDNIISSSTTRLIYAYGATDPADSSAPTEYHGNSNRGSKSVYLLLEPVSAPSPPANALSFEMKVDSFSVPKTDTTYHCSFHMPPTLNDKHHIISIETILQEGNEALVHHIVLYGCWGIEDAHLRDNNKTEGVCFTSEMPEFEDSCRSTLHAWAVGGGDFYYPDNAGFPLGGTDGVAPQYFMMEVHYDNPGLLDGLTDSSGFKLTYTPTLRDNDVGVLEIGMVSGIAVPPRPDRFQAVAFCDGSCTQEWIPAEGIELFSYALHTHLLGAAIQVDWYRDGQNIGILAYDDSYDFNFQENRNFETNKKLMPGDTLKITCTYTDPNRIPVTFGGIASSQEMCLAFIAYYPKQNLARCHSIPRMAYDPTDPIFASLSVDPNPYPEANRIGAFENVAEWNATAVALLQDAYDNSVHTSLCYKDGDEAYSSQFQQIDASSFPTAQREVSDTCDNDGDNVDGGDGNSSSTICGEVLLFLLSFLFLCVCSKF